MDPACPPSSPRHSVGVLTVKVADTLLSVLNVNGFVVVELVTRPVKAAEQLAAVNGLTTILFSL